MVVFKCHEDYLLLNNSPALSVASSNLLVPDVNEPKAEEESLADNQQLPEVTCKAETDFRTASVCADRTKLEKSLALLLLIAVIIVGVLIAALIHNSQYPGTALLTIVTFGWIVISLLLQKKHWRQEKSQSLEVLKCPSFQRLPRESRKMRFAQRQNAWRLVRSHKFFFAFLLFLISYFQHLISSDPLIEVWILALIFIR